MSLQLTATHHLAFATIDDATHFSQINSRKLIINFTVSSFDFSADFRQLIIISYQNRNALSPIPTANTGPTHSGHHTRQLVYLPSEL